jgi:hypothetical protein
MNDASKHPHALDDPDIWTVISLVVNGVSMFAQLASLRIQALSTSVPRGATIPYENLRDAVSHALGNVERLIRILGNAENPQVMRGSFRFGENTALLDSNWFSQYQQLVAQIALDVGNISTWTLTLVSHHQGTAKMLGERIVDRLGRVSDRINAIYRSEPSNEEVLDECLRMYRAFVEILSEIDRARN